MSTKPKYKYPEPVKIGTRQWPDRIITKPPVWVSVDLRDGNQALPVPMDPDTKIRFFRMLCDIGFKEIEVSFPSASQDDFDLVRRLIEEDLIPDDVRISVLTQARKHLIDRTVESLKGAKQAVVHLYVATSDLHGKFVFNRNRDDVLKMAVEGTQMVMDALKANGFGKEVGYEFSPEEFTDTDLDFALDVCKAVKETWGPSTKNNFILNLPATVERRPPYQYADMIELFIRKYPYMAETTVSLHAHNDQGCAVAATEMALLAGAERVEGTIFGHGERTGNLDISILGLNLQARGINTGLKFSNMPEIVELVENASGIPVHPRHPYAGSLVFTAFSGSHQDAIRKGMEHDVRSQSSDFFGQGWRVPYLHIDPADVGREYEKLIRINSQSGKGGIVFVLENEFNIFPPKQMHPDIGRIIQQVADAHGGELSTTKIKDTFMENFVNVQGPFSLKKYSRDDLDDCGSRVHAKVEIEAYGKDYTLDAEGNGPISAVVAAIAKCPEVPEFSLTNYSEKSRGEGAEATALAFVGLKFGERVIYAAGEHSNINRAALGALFSALNRATKELKSH
jgi:2-isopropylmalate synthase